MKRIIIHWTAGTHVANATDLSHYHFLIEGDGSLVIGSHPVSANEDCNDGDYAAHTGGGNTGSIGISMCGMANYQSGKPDSTSYPLTAKQFEACMDQVAQLAKQYNIPIDSDHIMTHYEFGIKNPTTSSAGKIDIIYLPHQPQLKKEEIGDYIRNKVLWYYQKLFS